MFSEPVSNIAQLGIVHGMKVADIGSGSGFYTINIARIVGSSGRVYAIDVQKDLLDRVHSIAKSEGLHNIEIIWANVEKIGGTKLRDVSVDRVVASNVLFQMTNIDDFVLEMKRILKPNGKMLVIDWSEVSMNGPKNFVTSARAQSAFEKVGFRLEKSFSAGDYHYGLVLQK